MKTVPYLVEESNLPDILIGKKITKAVYNHRYACIKLEFLDKNNKKDTLELPLDLFL